MTSRSSPQNQTSDDPTFCLHFSTGEIDSDYCERQTASSANRRYHTKTDPDHQSILELLFARILTGTELSKSLLLLSLLHYQDMEKAKRGRRHFVDELTDQLTRKNLVF